MTESVSTHRESALSMGEARVVLVVIWKTISRDRPSRSKSRRCVVPKKVTGTLLVRMLKSRM